MARYINEDDFVAWVKEHWCADCNNDNGLRCRVCWIDDAIDIVEEAPEADVVPKSEVDKTIAEFAYLHADVLNKLDNAKAEVAMEIFEEIEGIIAEQFRKLDFKNNQFDGISKDAISLFIGIVSDNLAELKNKYIPQDCPN